MEVLPSSGVSCIADSHCPDLGSRPLFMLARESNSEEHSEGVQLTDNRVGDLELNMKGPLEDREEASRWPVSEDHGIVDAHYEMKMDGEKFFSDSNDSGDKISESQQQSTVTRANITGSGQPSVNQEAEISIFESKWLETDESLALWVKWRGKWQAGIKCARADWPLSVLKVKPTQDEKKYLVIFFPRTRNFSWVDKLLVRPINEFPETIAYKAHEVGVKMVKDHTLAHRFVMQKLAVGTISILDQLHSEAFVENSQNVTAWKEFALEASQCIGYTDLGKMLLKLQNMILESFINSQWLQHSLPSWVQRCQNACTAELVDLLKEELVDYILWDVVHSLSSGTAQNELSTEWRTWKHEMMKWFSLVNPSSSESNHGQPSDGSPLDMEIQISRKRPKLEVRRAEMHTPNSQMVQSSHQVIAVENDLAFSNGDTIKTASLESKPATELPSLEGTTIPGAPGSMVEKWGEILVEARNSDVVQSNKAELSPVTGAICVRSFGTANKGRQCMAFIEHKGRQCVRWASEGDVYCCVHLTSRFSSCSAKVESRTPTDSPMCGGTTVLGTKCKHRSLVGSPFCKKHRPKDDNEMNSRLLENKLKRKHVERTNGSGSVDCREIVLYEGLETPVQSAPISFMGGLVGLPDQSHGQLPEMGRCIGLYPNHDAPCQESPKRYFLYCDKHLPTWLKRARNGKSRIISKEVFTDLLKDCQTLEQKLNLHRGCELFYRLFKSILSVRNPVPKEVQFQWALSEAAKDTVAGESLLKLVCREKERLERLWGFCINENMQTFTSVEAPGGVLMPVESDKDSETIKCKLCLEKFINDQTLGAHWMDHHRKEAKWYFRGYACSICLDSFTNKKVLESHVQERHQVQFVEECMFFQCIPCGSHFGNLEELWSHVLSVHPDSFKRPTVTEQQNLSAVVPHSQNPRPKKSSIMRNGSNDSQSASRKFICKFCGLKFDLLPDLGRHHQAAHMGESSAGVKPPKSGLRLYAQKLKTGRFNRPGFKKGIGSVPYRISSRNAQNMKKHICTSNLGTTAPLEIQTGGSDTASLGRLADSQCSAVAQVLFSETKKTKPRPTNLEILSIARMACCKVSLQKSLTAKYGTLPRRIYLKAAKLCSEQNILVNWHQEGFMCPQGCRTTVGQEQLSTLFPLSDNVVLPRRSEPFHPISSEWSMDECHYVIDSKHFNPDCAERIILCDDISFGKESIAIACAVDENLLGSIHGSDGQITASSCPWESFNYITKPLLDQRLVLEMENSLLGCDCAHSVCSPARCDHVYLFDNDYEDAKDIYGKSMHGRFPYDERGRIILEEGYLVYECNQNCGCSRGCQNRVLQNGVRVKLEIFKTETKGWAVRAREAILRGTFVCEYVGEVIDEQEANERRTRYGKVGCGYLFEVDAQMNDISRMTEEPGSFVIDSTNHGNVSRYINHSCSPNLANHQVLVESMECQLAHIGLFASRDINVGEELTYDYRYKLQPGEGCPCLCGAPNCRGRLC